MHAKIAMQFKQSVFQRLDISKIKPFISKLVESKKVAIELAIDANIQKLKAVEIKPKCIVDIELTVSGGRLVIAYEYNNLKVNNSNHTPYLIFNDFTYCLRNFEMEHTLRDIILHYHPSSTDENSITFESPYFDQIIGEINIRPLIILSSLKKAQKNY